MAGKQNRDEDDLEMIENEDGSYEVTDLDDEHSQDDEKNSSHDDDHGDDDEDRDAIRARRREERKSKKENARRREDEYRAHINNLKRQNDEMAERLARVENSTKGFQFAQLDKQIEDEATRLQYAKMRLKEAIARGNGDEAVEAQELYAEAKQKHDQLAHYKQQTMQQVKQPQGGVDRRVQNAAAKWLERNDWYDPDLKDRDSRLTKMIDNELTEEGWDPRDSSYWEELDNRLKKELPHKFKQARPRSTGGGREASSADGGSVGFQISKERVAAIKEAGMWDDVKARNRMIKQFQAYDKEQAKRR